MSERKLDTNPILGEADATAIRQALRRGATRREAMGMLTAAGMGAASAGVLVGSAERANAQAPRKGGRLRVAGHSTSTADTVDPAKQSLSTDYARCYMFYNSLTRLDESLTPQLELAESIDHVKATSWTIKLRKGVQFHDGKELTAADVVYSLNRHKDPQTGSRAKALADQMTEIKATGTHEVSIQLSAPNADLPVVFGTPHFLIIKDGTKDFQTAVGTGPYKVKEFTPGVRSVATRNQGYWGSKGPYIDEIEFFGIPDAAARVNALLSGDVQLVSAISPLATQQIRSTPGYEIFETRSGNYTDLVIRMDAQPTGNADFVKATQYMFNRELIKRAIFRDYAVVANDHPVDPTNRFYCKDIPQRPFDPDKAKFHFDKTGIGNAPIQLFASPAATMSIEMAEQLQQVGRRIGMNLDIQRVPADGYWSNYWMKKPVGFGNINPRPNADVLFSLFFKSDSPWNESAWKNEKFDQLLVAARAESDFAKRKQMYCDMQMLVHEHCGLGIPVFISGLDAHSSKVKGLTPVPTGGLMGYNFAEYLWLES
ncbi:MAG: ABC transporter substrate-binding protein [Alphaproteobacteria bacterium]|nr:ABC transporter substrate-binding protein [Alphaproteobacteria bacterium]